MSVQSSERGGPALPIGATAPDGEAGGPLVMVFNRLGMVALEFGTPPPETGGWRTCEGVLD